MIERILQYFRASDYDFRPTANPEDPRAHLFASLVPHYRMKAAIAQALAPRRILEIGVRDGYSGAAFLHGCPAAHLTGIDSADDGSGGPKGATNWAKNILPEGRFEIVAADTRKMTRLPGEIYDLIHVDGRRDGDGTFHDLEMAIRQGRHVLVENSLSAQKFRVVSEFLLRQESAIDYYAAIPGPAGGLLIKSRETALAPDLNPPGGTHSEAIREAYNEAYYLRDCGGWHSFGETRGRELDDPRLRCVFDLAMLRQPGRLLDLGCGRGEIACHAAAQGCEVVAVDYSQPAIDIARSSLDDAAPEIKERITLLCEDATGISLPQPVDVAVAGDLIEHLAPAEVERLYATVARQLTPEGLFVVHTFPNKWYYDYDYPRRRRLAASADAYLPPNPRSRYEQLMHINEQSPRVLRRQLRRHFPHVLLWFGSPQDPLGSLGRRFPIRALAAQRDLFALASNAPIDPAMVRQLFASAVLARPDVLNIHLETPQGALRLPAGQSARLAVMVKNDSSVSLGSYQPRPVHFAYHWLRAETRTVAVFEGRRSRLVPSCAPHSSRRYVPKFVAPVEPGDYILQMSLVQEGILWFNDLHAGAAIEIPVAVI